MSKNGSKRVTFSLEAPEAREVFLCGTFNEWDPTGTPLKRGRNGEWKTQLLLPPGAWEYRFRVDGSWVDDPAPDRVVPNAFGTTNCVRDL